MDIKETPDLNFYPIDLSIKEGLGTPESPSSNAPSTKIENSNIENSSNGSVVGTGTVQSPNFAPGASGWRLDSNGNIEANDGNFRGDITGASGTFTGSVTATSGTIGGWSINSLAIFKDGATDNTSAGMAAADYPFYAGKKYVDRTTAPFHVTPAGQLVASDIVATGVINAQSGYLSNGVWLGASDALICESTGMNVGTNGHIRGGQTTYNSGIGFFLGYSSGAYKLSIGDSTDGSKQLLWDGTDLIVNDSVLSNQSIFGDGSDGDVTISGDTTLTSDMYYNNLTINNTKTLNPGGYRIFVKGTLTNNGTIARNGNNGGNGGNGDVGANAGGVGGMAGAALATGSIYGGEAGGAGGAGAWTNGGYITGSAGSNGAASNPSFASNGSVGGYGGGVFGHPNIAGGTAGAATQTIQPIRNATFALIMREFSADNTVKYIKSSAGSGGGGGGSSYHSGGGGAEQATGGGGGGGSTGGIVFLSARKIVNDGVISANGGNGGNGGAYNVNMTTDQAGGAGGGAGGSGGLIVYLYQKLTGTGSITATKGTKGTKGADAPLGTYPGQDGTDGIDGRIIALRV